MASNKAHISKLQRSGNMMIVELRMQPWALELKIIYTVYNFVCIKDETKST